MAVPKKRTGHSDQGHRRSNWKATVPAISSCPNCGAPRHPHTLCGVCGFYKDRVVLKSMLDEDISAGDFFPGKGGDVAEDASVDTAATEEKPAKKTKKAAKAKKEEPSEDATGAEAPAAEDTKADEASTDE